MFVVMNASKMLAITYMYKLNSKLNLDNRSSIKIVAEETNVDGSGHQDQLQIFPMHKETFHHTKQEICVDVPFMYLVNYNNIVLVQKGVRGHLSQ